jgi:hypothetical protein
MKIPTNEVTQGMFFGLIVALAVVLFPQYTLTPVLKVIFDLKVLFGV